MSDRGTEIAALISEQEKDDRDHQVQRSGVSLDYEFKGGESFSAIVGYESGVGETAVRRVPRPQKWTRREIVKHVRAWVKEHGELPKNQDWNRPNGRGIPSTASLVRHFGSFNAAIAAAGFEPRGVGKCDPNPIPEGKVRPRIRPRQRRCARLTSDDLAAAYVLYDRKRLSVPALADLLWRKYGYPNAAACREALRKGFHAEGFKLRSKLEARRALPEEKRKQVYEAMLKGRRNTHHFSLQEIVEIRTSGERQQSLANRFGVSQSTISRIKRGLRSADVPA